MWLPESSTPYLGSPPSWRASYSTSRSCGRTSVPSPQPLPGPPRWFQLIGPGRRKLPEACGLLMLGTGCRWGAMRGEALINISSNNGLHTWGAPSPKAKSLFSFSFHLLRFMELGINGSLILQPPAHTPWPRPMGGNRSLGEGHDVLGESSC